MFGFGLTSQKSFCSMKLESNSCVQACLYTKNIKV